MQQRTLNNQDGIAIGEILFIIAVLAILAAAIASGAGSFNANTNNDSAKTKAGTIIQQADAVAMAVQKVYVENGCADTQISFANPVVSLYTNPNSPSDNSCNVFNQNGGAMLFPTPPQGSLNGTLANSANYIFAGFFVFYQIGTGAPELTIMASDVTSSVCS